VIVTDATQFSRGFWVPCLLTEFFWSLELCLVQGIMTWHKLTG